MSHCRIWYICLLLFLSREEAGAQRHPLTVAAEQKPAADFFAELSRQSGVTIIFSDNIIARLPDITLYMTAATLDEVLKTALEGSGVGHRYSGMHIVVLYAKPQAVQRFIVSGTVTDSVSGEPLISAYVFDAVNGKGTVTNNYGYYNLTLPAGNVRLLSGYLGFSPAEIRLDLHKNERLHVRLRPNGLLEEVVVHADHRPWQEKGALHPADRITAQDLLHTTHAGGAADIYRALDFVPGVQTGTDGVGGIQVRGGANDQNLILMDGVPVYHPNHLLGMVSVFNHYALHQASVYKANFPSRFSGRLSSVMDVRTREGNIHDWSLSGQVALSEVNLMTEGPLVKEKIGLMLSSRYFLPGLVMRDLTRRIKQRNGVGGLADIDYFDFNGKINYLISRRDRIYFSIYRGNDRFFDLTQTERTIISSEDGLPVDAREEFRKDLNWRNRTAVFRWNHFLGDNAFSNFILSHSSFQLQSVDRSQFVFTFPQSGQEPVSGFDAKEFKSGIEDITARLELDIRPSADHQFSVGAYGIRYRFRPKSITINEESKVGDFYLNEGLLDDVYFSSFRVTAAEAGIYLEDKWDINPQWRLSSGMHISGFFVQGVHYLDPQLRISLVFQPDSRFYFNAGYSRMAQYLHHLTSAGIGLPTDLWVPTTSRVSPSLSDQYAASFVWKPGQRVTADISCYVKDMRSLVSYQEGASFLLREGLLPSSIVDAANWESKITEGDGDAAGMELRLAYDHKRLRLKSGATWSKSNRRFDAINEGLPFPDRHDRRWSFGVSAQWQAGPKWSFNANWLYGSGIAITLAESKFFNPGTFFPETGIHYSARNGFRLPPYHRLDINIRYDFSDTPAFTHFLALNLYNVYNRTNPFYITLVHDSLSQEFEFRQFSLFRFVPSLSYCFSIL